METDEFDTAFEQYELTNIKVKEVSLVDRAANKRKFLVMKRDRSAVVAADPAAIERAQKNFGNTAAAELDRKDAEPKVETAKSEVDIVVTETSTGLDVQVTSATPSFAEGSTQYALQQKIQAAWMGAIGAIRARLDAMAEAVMLPSESLYVDYAAYNHLDAIRCMLECFYDIGGPEWEMEVAAVTAAAAKGENVAKKRQEMAKIGRAISTSRMRSLKDMHSKVTDLYKMFGDLMAEVDVDTEKSAPAVGTGSVAVTAPAVKTDTIATAEVQNVVVTPAVVAEVVVAPAVTTVVDISQDPAFKALKEALDAQAALIKAQTEQMTELKTKTDAQEKELAKARSTVRSNALTPEPQQKQTGYVWPMDMAARNRF